MSSEEERSTNGGRGGERSEKASPIGDIRSCLQFEVVTGWPIGKTMDGTKAQLTGRKKNHGLIYSKGVNEKSKKNERLVKRGKRRRFLHSVDELPRKITENKSLTANKVSGNTKVRKGAWGA